MSSTATNTQALRLHLLPLALGLIVLGTAVPVELRARIGWTVAMHPGDVGVNVLLYVPLGWALWRGKLPWVTLAAALLSGSIEWLQAGFASRHPSTLDVFCNTAGAVIGWVLAHALARGRGEASGNGPPPRPEVLKPRPWMHAACALGALAMGAHWFLPPQTQPLATWDERYRLRQGPEDLGDAAWRGSLRGLRLAPHATTAGDKGPDGMCDVPTTSSASSDPLPSVEEVRRFVAQARNTHAFTLCAQVHVDAVDDEGPLSIASLSGESPMRNLNLAQTYGRLALRVRTPLTGLDGMTPHVSTPTVLTPGTWHHVVGSFDGRIARIHVDGNLRGRSNLAAAACPLRSLCDSDLPMMAGLLGACLGVLAAAWAARRGRQGKVQAPTAALLGATLGALMVVARSSPTSPIVLGAEAGVLVLLGGACVAWAAWLAQRSAPGQPGSAGAAGRVNA